MRDRFYYMIAHGHVPCSFGEGFIVPLVKDKSSNLNSIDNYRPIPIISEVFEHVLLSPCEDVLYTDNLQFVFKNSRSCTDAIFTLRTAVSHFSAKGSTVSCCTRYKESF